jgi:hypothetical protein
MLFTEWNLKDALEVAREEGMEKVFSLLRQGYSVDEAEKMLATRET